jgi:2-oxoglutarate dehydrogenase E1 component
MTDQLNIENLTYLDELYQKYLTEPAALGDEWRRYFAQTANGNGHRPDQRRPALAAGISQSLQFSSEIASTLPTQLNELIHAYRSYGHLKARLDPLARVNHLPYADVNLQPEMFGFTESHMDKLLASASLPISAPMTLREFVVLLEQLYCGPIGFEFMHITDEVKRNWLRERIEQKVDDPHFDSAKQIRFLERLIATQTFEQFLRKKFLGAKSFSLEGAECVIPLLDLAITIAADQGSNEIVLAMPHRGRLNVLANILGKPPRDIFREFMDPSVIHADGSGDVKYHLGYSHDYRTQNNQDVHLSLCFNPSHLEYVVPVALGRVRAKQSRRRDRERIDTVAFLLHGDAAFAGEGIILETLNLSKPAAYQTGGALHVVINNQIGFTTPPAAARSSIYATDVAKVLDIPVFHVNGDEPQAVAHVVKLALDFRAAFHHDVIIDLYCYRRFGHNESDEPSFTQPRLYQAIARRKNLRQLFAAQLLAQQRVTAAQIANLEAKCLRHLEEEFQLARDQHQEAPTQAPLQGIWEGYRGGPKDNAEEDIATAIDRDSLLRLFDSQTRLPESFRPHPKITRALQTRRKMATGELPVDWSAAEALALASLAARGVSIRLTGQDSERGTFSQRHAVLHDYQNGHEYIPLQHVARDQASVEIHDSPLSEAGVLGFEYGYSLDSPDGLTLWEAQFGDFSNAAQVIIDQFITTAEEKWRRLSGLVLLLPHGFEGMGPEHSSARLERFLQLGAKDNIQVVYPSTPAQYFHCLRRQSLRQWRKPLVLMTPKSLLRHPRSVSRLEDFTDGRFLPVLTDRRGVSPAAKLLLCSGKIYYDLEKKRQALNRIDIPIIRIEQLYPFPERELRSALTNFPAPTQLIWVQEEPENMGAWWYLNQQFAKQMAEGRPLSVVARASAASPATGSATRHKAQQEELLDKAFAAVTG